MTMKIKAPASHDLAQLHDELKAAGLIVLGVPLTYDKDDPTFIIVPEKEGVTQAAVSAVFAAHSPTARPAPPNLRQLADNFRSAVTAATTVNQIKAALNKELMLLLREVARGHRGETNGGS